MTPAHLLTLVCAIASAALLVAEWRESPGLRLLFKLGASSAFVALALVLGGLDSHYGRWVLAALVLGWLGDALLLSNRAVCFLSGLGVFLVSHVAYALAFVSGPWAWSASAWALLPAAVVGAVALRWLWPHLDGGFRLPVVAYVSVILLMVVAAVGRGAGAGLWLPLCGALLFAASDLAVARERFVARAFTNRAWGLPTYFAAQLLLAWSIAWPL